METLSIAAMVLGTILFLVCLYLRGTSKLDVASLIKTLSRFQNTIKNQNATIQALQEKVSDLEDDVGLNEKGQDFSTAERLDMIDRRQQRAERTARSQGNSLESRAIELRDVLRTFRGAESTVAILKEALGGVWRTASGHLVPIRILDTSHIANIIEGGFGSAKIRQTLVAELRRRQEGNNIINGDNAKALNALTGKVR